MSGTRRAICVGIDEYEGDDRLDLCVADATEVAEYLGLPQYGFEVDLLINGEATRPNLRRTLISAMQDDLEFFIFYFSGHGIVTDLGAYLVTIDHQPFEEGLSLSDLSLFIERISTNVPHCLTILDCCHSGAGNIGSGLACITPDDIDRGIPARTESRTLLAACRPEQFAVEDSRYGHGLFTYSLLEGLDGDAADHKGDVTVGGLAEFIVTELDSIGAEQIAVTKGDSAGRVVLGSGFPPISREDLPQSERKRILEQGKQFLEDYTSQLQNRAEDWRRDGHRTASKMLAPTLRWFERNRREHRDLYTDPEFSQLYISAFNRAKQLAEIDLGTQLELGTVTRIIGGGGFGTVYEVTGDGEKLAYKVYHPTEYGNAEKRSLFSRGYRAMEQLDHPRVVKVRGYTEAPLGFFMEYVDGPNFMDLPNIIEDPAAILRFLLLTAETIAHAHSRTVIHRDIKPQNILALYDQERETWLPYLCDFDLAWFGQATQVTRDAWGNLSYAAPEQMTNPRSAAAHSAHVDIYAFAQLSYFAITGTDPVPLGRANNTRLLQEKLNAWPVGSAAQRFIDWYVRCSESEPNKRFANFRAAMDELAEIESELRSPDNRKLTVQRTINEIGFALSGFSAAESAVSSGGAFTSASGRTSINLASDKPNIEESARTVDIIATLKLYNIQLEGNMSNERKRALLNSRIDEIVRTFPGVKRKPGTQGTFETFIIIQGVDCDRNGIQHARLVLSHIIEAIER
ncbi:protein kinase domain-containing protein [Microbispora sp. H10836]|uniref:protein kinase domain-containing protein n=1 Tax=Microbispora sp. H10836 TaxID=2729106 RepID=UPI00147673D7|nr:protein kinase [Microbispora sp. H10836]